MFKRLVVAVVVSLLFVSWVSAASAGVRLEYKVKKDDVFRVRTTTSGAGEMELNQNGQITNFAMEMVMDVTMTDKVTAVGDKGVFDTDEEFAMHSFTVKLNGNEVPIPASPDVKPKVKRDKLGKVLEVKGLENLAAGGNLDLSKLLSSAAPIFPDKELNVGDTWVIKPEAGSPLPYEVSGKLLALEKVNGKDCAKVEAKMNFDMAKASELIPEIMGMKLKMSGTTSSTMTLYVALDSGWIVKGDGTTDVDVTVEIENFAKIQQKMKMKMEMKEEKPTA